MAKPRNHGSGHCPPRRTERKGPGSSCPDALQVVPPLTLPANASRNNPFARRGHCAAAGDDGEGARALWAGSAGVPDPRRSSLGGTDGVRHPTTRPHLAGQVFRAVNTVNIPALRTVNTAPPPIGRSAPALGARPRTACKPHCFTLTAFASPSAPLMRAPHRDLRETASPSPAAQVLHHSYESFDTEQRLFAMTQRQRGSYAQSLVGDRTRGAGRAAG
jgi:hypothetical protein